MRLNLKRPVVDAHGNPVLVAEGDDKGKPVLQNRHGSDLLGQLIHWAAHAVAGASASAEGRYHGPTFAKVAEELGLVIKYAKYRRYAPEVVTSTATRWRR